MNPNDQQIAAIRGYVAAMPNGWGNDDAEIRGSMQGEMVTNPLPQETVITPFDATTVFESGQLSTGSVTKLLALPSFHDVVVPLLNVEGKAAEDIANLNVWAATYEMGGMITPAEYAYMAGAGGIFNRTGPDPSWTSRVGWDVANLGRPVDDFDIEMSRIKE